MLGLLRYLLLGAFIFFTVILFQLIRRDRES